MTIVNLTPHTVRLNCGKEFPPIGQIARVSASYTEADENGVCSAVFGDISGLPEPQENTLFVVSALVAQASKRADVVSPATGHPMAVRRDGQVWSVPCWVRAEGSR